MIDILHDFIYVDMYYLYYQISYGFVYKVYVWSCRISTINSSNCYLLLGLAQTASFPNGVAHLAADGAGIWGC